MQLLTSHYLIWDKVGWLNALECHGLFQVAFLINISSWPHPSQFHNFFLVILIAESSVDEI